MDALMTVSGVVSALTVEPSVGYKAQAWLASSGISAAIRQSTSAIGSAFITGSWAMRFTNSKLQAISALRSVLSYMMTVRSRMSLVMSSGTPSTKSDNDIRAFATLRFAGDALDPDEISRIIKEQPTKAYRKGETYRSGPHGPDVTGRTGVWYFSTRQKIPSTDLADHLSVLDRLVAPFGDQDNLLKELRDIMGRRNLQAHVSLFWRGPPGTQHPSVPSVATAALRRLPADIEPDFANEDC
jgi:hypothetical protein